MREDGHTVGLGAWRRRTAATFGLVIAAMLTIGAGVGAAAPDPLGLGDALGEAISPPASQPSSAPPGAPAPAPAPQKPRPGPPPPAASTRRPPCDTCWVLMGDSVAHSFEDAFRAEGRRRGISVVTSTRSGCGMVTALTVNRDGTAMPWSQRCADNTASYQTTAMRQARAKVAIWHSTWELGYHVIKGQQVTLGTPGGDAAMLEELEDAVMRITAGGFNGRLVILTVVPRAEHSDALKPDKEDLRTPPLLNSLFNVLETRYPGLVTVVDLNEIVCPGGPPCPETIDGIRPRPWDGGHFGGDGPGWLAPKLVDAILAALQRPPAVAR